MPAWVPLIGAPQILSDTSIRFVGGQQPASTGAAQIYNVAVVMNNQQFGGGTVSADVTFGEKPSGDAVMGVILNRQPSSDALVIAQFGGKELCSLLTFAPPAIGVPHQWHRHLGTGVGTVIEGQRPYRFEARVRGSSVTVSLDGVEVLSGALPYPLPLGNAGLWFAGPVDIEVSSFQVDTATPVAFVVMQFTPPYNELFDQVIRPVCESEAMGLRAQRADDMYGPGVIIQDIERQIVDSRLVIADITPRNLNVYYEVGFAHALKKDTILIAEKPAELPFDVSPFRVLFYDNTIAGKAKVEQGLHKHLKAILGRG